jgi:hypothetical protein
MSNELPDQLDFFATSAAIEPQQRSVPPTGMTSWRNNIKPPHVLGGAAIAATLIWATWPYFFESSQPPGSLQIAPGASASKLFADLNEPRASAPREANQSQLAASRLSGNTVNLVLETALDRVKTRVEDLQNRISQLESQQALAKPNSVDVAAASPSSSTPASAAIKASQRHHRQPDKPATTQARAVLTQYRLNTLYPGQAWIEDQQQQTHVVEPGSVLDGIRIERIDTRRRVVMTSQGDIR